MSTPSTPPAATSSSTSRAARNPFATPSSSLSDGDDGQSRVHLDEGRADLQRAPSSISELKLPARRGDQVLEQLSSDTCRTHNVGTEMLNANQLISSHQYELRITTWSARNRIKTGYAFCVDTNACTSL